MSSAEVATRMKYCKWTSLVLWRRMEGAAGMESDFSAHFFAALWMIGVLYSQKQVILTTHPKNSEVSWSHSPLHFCLEMILGFVQWCVTIPASVLSVAYFSVIFFHEWQLRRKNVCAEWLWDCGGSTWVIPTQRDGGENWERKNVQLKHLSAERKSFTHQQSNEWIPHFPRAGRCWAKTNPCPEALPALCLWSGLSLGLPVPPAPPAPPALTGEVRSRDLLSNNWNIPMFPTASSTNPSEVLPAAAKEMNSVPAKPRMKKALWGDGAQLVSGLPNFQDPWEFNFFFSILSHILSNYPVPNLREWENKKEQALATTIVVWPNLIWATLGFAFLLPGNLCSVIRN